jgi:hypothetical protein
MRFVAVAAVLVIAVVGCGGLDWDDAWVDAQGRRVSEDVIVSYRGAGHCDWESAVFLELAWPVGHPQPTFAGKRLYVRDADGRFADNLESTFEDDATLPAEARFSGYRRDDAELWISPSEAHTEVYIVRGERVERWPRAREVIACA